MDLVPEAEMQAFGFNDVWVNFRKFIRRYAEELASSRAGVRLP